MNISRFMHFCIDIKDVLKLVVTHQETKDCVQQN